MKFITRLTAFIIYGILTTPLVYAGLSQEVVTQAAYNSNINSVSFQQDAIITYKNYQYAVYWSRNQHVAVARKSLPSGDWETLELTDFKFATANAHYDISMGISPRDGTLHLSFDQWSSEFRYRKSVANLLNNPSAFTWNKSLFGPLQNHLQGTVMNPTTYPRFITEPSGKMLLLLRHGASGAGDSFLYEYDGNNGQWSTLGKLVDGFATDINAYFNGMHYDMNGRLHASWVWRATPDASTNFDLHYIYSDDDGRTWYNNAGQQIGRTGSNPISERTPGITVWNIAQNRGLINQESQTIDADGRVSMLMSHMRDSAPSNSNFEQARHKAYVFHYLRDLSGKWTRTELGGSSFSYDRNKIISDSDNTLYAVINRDGIYRATQKNNWKDWSLLQSLADQALYGEVQIDRERMAFDHTLSFLNLASPGHMRVYNFTDDNPIASSKAGGAPEGYIFCAEENENCTFSGSADVIFGASGKFFHRQASNSYACNSANFGDPIRGTVKRCYYSKNTLEGGPAGYELCVAEGEDCSMTGTHSVAFGAKGQFNYRIATDTIRCNTAEFSDAINGTLKSCFIHPRNLAASAEPPQSSSSSSLSSSSRSSSSAQTSSSSSQPTVPKAGSLHLPVLLLLALYGGILNARQRRGRRVAVLR